MLTVITPATVMDLTTVAAVKAELAVSGSGDDAWLADAITRASAIIRRWCNRVFAAETVRETYRLARPVPELLLSRLPVVTIASVTVDGTALASTVYEADAEQGTLYRLDSRRRFLCWSGDVIDVEYTAGFTMPGAVGRTLPEDVEAACIALCVRAYHAKGRDPALRSYTNVDVETFSLLDPDKAGGDGGLPADVAERLQPYRSVVLG
ncbi:hypothetical protein VY88_10540 [Azospirillum thiophilum]|uniref:Phage gp6-like head-tail connector protein n=2 Tax=Azospirillum thiophilum TaxID=528244 RepID=A0AAC8VYP8_9PROT|nr:hypothetical protein AL072_02170 [Azospirillum thiophilum]KJR67288.1 hypothetical protein VY88_10540 [Azospirillum thiophilum]